MLHFEKSDKEATAERGVLAVYACCLLVRIRTLAHAPCGTPPVLMMPPMRRVGTTAKRTVSALTTAQCTKSKRWKLRCTYYPAPRARGTRKDTLHMYQTAAEALEHADIWTTWLCTPNDCTAAPTKSEKTGRIVKICTGGKGRNKTYKEVNEPIIGYEGKPKGVCQMVWERGLWEEG